MVFPIQDGGRRRRLGWRTSGEKLSQFYSGLSQSVVSKPLAKKFTVYLSWQYYDMSFFVSYFALVYLHYNHTCVIIM